MLAATLVQKLADARQLFDDRLVLGNLAIKHAQRIGDGAALAVLAHTGNHRLKRLAQSLVVRRTIAGATDRIQLQRPVSNAKAVEQCRQQLQHFRIARRRLAARAGRPNDLRTDLVELAISPLLRTLPPKLRTDVVELVQPAIPKFVLDVGAHHAGGVFRAKSKRLAFLTLRPSAVFPGIHLLRDHVGFLAHTTSKKFGRLENRRAYLVKIVSAENVTHRRLDKVPQRRLRRQKIARSSYGFDHEYRPSALSFKFSVLSFDLNPCFAPPVRKNT